MGDTPRGMEPDDGSWPSQWQAKAIPLAEITTDRIINSTVPLPRLVVSKRACKGLPTDDFFPPVTRTESRYHVTTEYLETFDMCYACPVRQDCLQHAMDTWEDHGIWGGVPSFVRVKSRRRGLSAGEVIAEDNEWRREHKLLGVKEKKKRPTEMVKLRCSFCNKPFERRARDHRSRLKMGCTTWFDSNACRYNAQKR